MEPPCPNCGVPADENASICPNCGAPLARGSVWPAPPPGYYAPPPESSLLTKWAWLDLTLAFVGTLLLISVVGAGYIWVLIANTVLRRYKYLVWGTNIAAIVPVLIVLGVFVWCFASFAGWHK